MYGLVVFGNGGGLLFRALKPNDYSETSDFVVRFYCLIISFLGFEDHLRNVCYCHSEGPLVLIF